jgi:hypothetical protein
MRHSLLSVRYVLINLAIASVAIFLVVNMLRGGEVRSPSPQLQRWTSGDELRLPDPISASQYVKVDGESFMLAMTKHDNEHLETADLRIVSLDPDQDLEQVGWIHTSMSVMRPPEALTYARGHVYVGIAREGMERPALWVVDLSNPRRPFEANLLHAPMPIRSLAASEDGYMYASGFDDEFLIYDLSQPNEPVIVDSFRFDVERAPQLLLSEDALFINDSRRVSVLDLTDPFAPEMTDMFENPQWTPPGFYPSPDTFLSGTEGFDVNLPRNAFLDIAASQDLVAIAGGEDGLTLMRSDNDESSSIDVPLEGRSVSVAIAGETLHILTAQQLEGSTVRFSVHQGDVSVLETPIQMDVSERYTGIPRYQQLVAQEKQRWILFNSTIIRY